jgi:hypothetical protein
MPLREDFAFLLSYLSYLFLCVWGFNIFYLYSFHKRLFEKGLVKRDNVRYYPLTDPDFYRISILPDNIKLMVTETLYNYIEWLEQEQNPDLYANHERPGSYVKRIIKLMNTGEGGHHGFSPEENKKRLKMCFFDNFPFKFSNYLCLVIY